MATDQLTDEVSRVVMSLFNSSEVAFLTSCFFLRGAKRSKEIYAEYVHIPLTDEYLLSFDFKSFKSNTLQNERARSKYLNILKIELFIKKMPQHITFNFIIIKKNWQTRTSCCVIYNNDRDLMQIGILIACRNWEIMLLKYRRSVKKNMNIPNTTAELFIMIFDN